jgi:hypothetical protein
MNYGGKRFLWLHGQLRPKELMHKLNRYRSWRKLYYFRNIYSEGLSEELIAQAIKNLCINKETIWFWLQSQSSMGR